VTAPPPKLPDLFLATVPKTMATDFVFFLGAILMVVALIGLLLWFFFLWDR